MVLDQGNSRCVPWPKYNVKCRHETAVDDEGNRHYRRYRPPVDVPILKAMCSACLQQHSGMCSCVRQAHTGTSFAVLCSFQIDPGTTSLI